MNGKWYKQLIGDILWLKLEEINKDYGCFQEDVAASNTTPENIHFLRSKWTDFT